MANIKSAKKRIRVSTRQASVNKARRSALRTIVKKTNLATLEKSADMDVLLKESVKSIDKAVAKGLLHKNTAARKKSKLMRFANATK